MEALNFAPSANLWQQQTRTLRHPALQNFMRPPRFAQRIDLTFSHVHFNHPAGDQRKQFTAGFLQFFPVGDIALQRWASDVQGAF